MDSVENKNVKDIWVFVHVIIIWLYESKSGIVTCRPLYNFYSQLLGFFPFHWNSTSGNHETAGSGEAGGFVNNAVTTAGLTAPGCSLDLPGTIPAEQKTFLGRHVEKKASGPCKCHTVNIDFRHEQQQNVPLNKCYIFWYANKPHVNIPKDLKVCCELCRRHGRVSGWLFANFCS